jgi:pimeloyl-ACP methyl ester carboxylesterase
MLRRVPSDKAVLVLHGITMSGESMLRTLGPLRTSLEARNLTLVAPNAGHRMSPEEVSSTASWTLDIFEKAGQDAREWFRDGKFWIGEEHYDWFRSNTDKATGEKTYEAVEQSLDAVARAIRGRNVSGVLGFSQGSAMAILVAARALAGDVRFESIRWGVFLTGFKPVFDHPRVVAYPAPAKNFAALFVIGDRDPIFPGGSKHLASMARAFDGGTQELLLIPGLGHDVPDAAEDVERIAEFAATERAGVAT